MADILIKGLDLPKDGHYYLEVFTDGEIRRCDNVAEGVVNTDSEAIELPSVGRWIDGQELKAFLKRKMCDVRCAEGKMNCDVCVVSTLFEVIDKSPTLVCEED